MTATNITPDVVRDTELEQRLLEAVIADQNARPRNKQLQVGPSGVGGCRELLRAGLFESQTLVEEPTHWMTAAWAGTVLGDSLEDTFGRRLDAVTQQRVTTMFGSLGVQLSGATDLIFVDRDIISDLKSNADIGGVLYDFKRNASIIETLLELRAEGTLFQKNIETPHGGYELTEVLISKIAKLHYYVQIAIYVMGAMQAGVLSENASGRLVFYDRSGQYQEFVAFVISSAEIDLFYDIGQRRIEQVVQAQMAYEATGNPAVKAHLRDMSPSYCFSKKVLCPLRMTCWAGSDWTSENQITNPEQIAATNRYIIGRDLAKLGDGMKRAAKEELKDVSGVLPDGKMVTWTANGAINVVETTMHETPMQEHLDQYVPVSDVLAEVDAEQERKAAGVDDAAAARRAMRERDLTKLQKPELVALCAAAGLEPKGVKATLVERILDHEAEHGEISQEAEAPAEADELTEAIVEAAAQPVDPTAITEVTEPERDQRIDRVHFVDTDPRPLAEVVDGALDELAAEVINGQAGGYEPAEVLQARQRLFGLNEQELQAEAIQRRINPFEPRQNVIQLILDHDYPPVVGRGWKPNGAGTSGDAWTDRLKQMQYNADPQMRKMYGSEEQA